MPSLCMYVCICVCMYVCMHVCICMYMCIPIPAHSPCFDHLNIIWGLVRIMKPLVVSFSPASSYLSPSAPNIFLNSLFPQVFEVLTAVTMKCYIFWNITPCRPVKVDQSSGRKYRLHLQGQRVNQSRNQHETGSACCWFMLVSSLVYSSTLKMKVIMFLWNVGWIYPRTQNSLPSIRFLQQVRLYFIYIYMRREHKIPDLEGNICSQSVSS
jgi:hypothetical protein